MKWEIKMVASVMLKKASVSKQASKMFDAANGFFDKLLRAIYVTLLFAFDFVLFMYSINGKVIEDGVINQALLVIVGGFFIFSFVLMLLLFFSGMVQNIICALITILITVTFFYQFALFNVDTFIETWLDEHASALSFIGIIPSCWLVGLFLGVLVFFLFRYTTVLLLIDISLGSFVYLYINKIETQVYPKTEYQVVQDFNDSSDGKKHNLIYLMMPKFPSYHFLSTVKDVNFRELRDLMIGFYAVNDFEIYPNAFVQKNDTVSNVVDIYNQVNYMSTSSQDRGYAQILNDWDFVHGQLVYWGLEDNQLYDVLQKNNYKISTYSLSEFPLCYKQDNLLGNRCVLKSSKIVKLYDKQSSLEKNVYALLSEWVLSFKSRDLKSLAKMFIDMSSLRGYKVLSENRRLSLEGGEAIFEKISEDFKKDNSGHVYMGYVDLPSDIYIYDEFCNVKPRKNWVALKDNTLYSGGIDEKRKAYVEQTKCLLGLLQMYMEDLRQTEKFNETDLIIQGLSTVREFSGMTAGQYGNFVSDKLVSMGIRHSKKPHFVVNTNICLASDISKSVITGENSCYTIDNMKMSTEDALNLKQNLMKNAIIRGSKISNIAEDYRDWYEIFKARSSVYQAYMEKNKAEQVKVEVLPENEIVNDDVVKENIPVVENKEVVSDLAAEKTETKEVEDLISLEEQNEAGGREEVVSVASEANTEPVVEQENNASDLEQEGVEEMPVDNENQENVSDNASMADISDTVLVEDVAEANSEKNAVEEKDE